MKYDNLDIIPREIANNVECDMCQRTVTLGSMVEASDDLMNSDDRVDTYFRYCTECAEQQGINISPDLRYKLEDADEAEEQVLQQRLNLAQNGNCNHMSVMDTGVDGHYCDICQQKYHGVLINMKFPELSSNSYKPELIVCASCIEDKHLVLSDSVKLQLKYQGA